MGGVSVQSPRAAIRTVRDLRGALSLQMFEAHRSAGPFIRRELDDAERLRHGIVRARTEPRRFQPATAGRLLSVWNAYVLQTVGEHLLDAVRHRSFGAVRAEVAAQ